jgi:hypothetical protein
MTSQPKPGAHEAVRSPESMPVEPLFDELGRVSSLATTERASAAPEAKVPANV